MNTGNSSSNKHYKHQLNWTGQKLYSSHKLQCEWQ